MSETNKHLNEHEKTIVFSSEQNKVNEVAEDVTRIESTPSHPVDKLTANQKEVSNMVSNRGNNGITSVAGPNPDDLKKLGEDKSGKVSSGVFAAGVGATALGGVATGTVFSDDIKGVFDVPAEDAKELTDAQMKDASDVVVDSTAVNGSTQVPEGAEDSTLNMHFSDSSGVYEVSYTDHNSDGEIDALSGKAELVDGSSVSFSATGDALHELLSQNHLALATPQDYVHASVHNVFEGFNHETTGVMSYEIQSGDTLSEIAAAHHTSIGRLLELNPHITDANVIMAGDDIVIPTDDHETNPYAGWHPTSHQTQDITTTPVENVPVQHNIEAQDTVDEDIEEDCQEIDVLDQTDSPDAGLGLFEGMGTGSDLDSEYSELDWQSFEDQPVDEYSYVLNQTSFDGYDEPASFLDTSNDLDSLDFI